MFVLGVGIGSVMQVLVIAVQNAVDYSLLGTATSGATYFRSIGGSFGTAVFGAIFVAQLRPNLSRDLSGVHLPSSFSATAGASPAALRALPPAVHRGFVDAYASSLQTVFKWAVPVAVLAFGLAWLIKEVPLRRSVTATNPADTLAPTAVPAVRSSLEELARAVSVLSQGANSAQIYTNLATRAGVDMDPRSTWTLLRLGEHPGWVPDKLADHLHVPLPSLETAIAELADSGLADVATDGDGTEHVGLTPEGQSNLDKLVLARREGLSELLSDWSPELYDEVTSMVSRLAADLLRDEPVGQH